MNYICLSDSTYSLLCQLGKQGRSNQTEGGLLYYPPHRGAGWGGGLLCHVIEISKSWSTLLYFSLTGAMFAGVSLSSLIIKQRSPLFCRLKGFPNLINTGRNNNNKSINNGNMASSVLSYFLQSREHGWMRGESHVRAALVSPVFCAWLERRGGGKKKKKNYRGDDIHCSLRVLTRRLSIPRLPRWSTQVKRMPCVSSVFTLKDSTRTSKRATVTIAWPPRRPQCT